MKNPDLIKILLLLLSGLLIPILKLFIPIGGGGISLAFVIIIPLTIGIAILFSLIYYALLKRTTLKNIVFYVGIVLNILISIALYPYDN